MAEASFFPGATRRTRVWLVCFVYIHSPVARTFFCCTVLSAHIRTSSCVCTYTHGSSSSRVKKVFVAHVSCLLYLMFHPSLLFLYIHFDIPFQSTILPYCPVLKAQDKRHSAHASRSLAKSDANTFRSWEACGGCGSWRCYCLDIDCCFSACCCVCFCFQILVSENLSFCL